MNNFPSRRERRALAKQFGLTKKKESLKEYSERVSRAQQLGKQIHLYHLQNQENARLNPEESDESLTPLFLNEPLEETIEENLEQTPEASTEAAVTVEAENIQPIGGENQD
jgi:hypothetical protein